MRVAPPRRHLPVVEGLVWVVSAAAGRRPRIGPLRDGVGAGRFQHSEWTSLLSRFVQNGTVEYSTMVRVRRLLEVYLQRLADIDPEAFVDADDQLAFYLNAYNAIAVHQVLCNYPIASIREIPGAFLRPYPVGRRNLSLHSLHSHVLRAFRDPRVHVAIAPAARGGPQLMPYAFTGAGLQAELDAALRRFLGDEQRGIRFDPATRTLFVAPMLTWFAADFLRPYAMATLSNLLPGRAGPGAVLHALRPMLPPAANAALDSGPRIRTSTLDWALNERMPELSRRATLGR